MADSESTPSESSFFENLFAEITSSFLNLTLIGVIVFLAYKILKNQFTKPPVVPEEQPLSKIRKDFTVEELRAYDGHNTDGRILMAVNGKVFDVTRGKRFYGPGMWLGNVVRPGARNPEAHYPNGIIFMFLGVFFVMVTSLSSDNLAHRFTYLSYVSE